MNKLQIISLIHILNYIICIPIGICLFLTDKNVNKNDLYYFNISSLLYHKNSRFVVASSLCLNMIINTLFNYVIYMELESNLVVIFGNIISKYYFSIGTKRLV